MLNAGLLGAIVVDDWKARMWAQVLPKIKVSEDGRAAHGSVTGWAVRKDSPSSSPWPTDFYKTSTKRQQPGARLAQYYGRIKQISNNTHGATGSASRRR